MLLKSFIPGAHHDVKMPVKKDVAGQNGQSSHCKDATLSPLHRRFVGPAGSMRVAGNREGFSPSHGPPVANGCADLKNYYSKRPAKPFESLWLHAGVPLELPMQEGALTYVDSRGLQSFPLRAVEGRRVSRAEGELSSGDRHDVPADLPMEEDAGQWADPPV